ncbi:MAG: hypothetical protein AAGA48_26660 [Myxococcota bacterium]
MIDLLTRSVSGAILFREAARTSRRWQTYGARTLFSGVLIAVVLLGLEVATGASRSAGMDAADLGTVGRTLFVVFCVVQLGLAMVLAPLTTSAAIVEERTDQTFDLLVLTRLQPGQIFGGKVLSRILVLLTVVLGAMPVLALVVNFGGVSTTEVVALTAHTLVNVVLMGLLGAFFGLFTRSPLLAMMASTAYSIPFLVLLPLGYALVSGGPERATHLSTLSAWVATDLWSLLPMVGLIPAIVVIGRLAAPLFQLQVSGADFEASLSDEVWQVRRGVVGFVVWVLLAIFTFPFAGSLAWYAAQPSVVSWSDMTSVVLYGTAHVWLFVMFSALMALGTWAYLRVAVDVVDGIDGIFTRPVTGDRLGRAGSLGRHPVWWREARMQAWGSSAAPILVTWGLVLLAIFQTGAWLAPGVLLAIGIGNTAAVFVLTGWLASRTIAEERRRGTLEVLLVTTIRTPAVVFGKAAGAMLPTLPLMVVGLPMIAFGFAYLETVIRYDGKTFSWDPIQQGALMWAWAVPVWGCVSVAAMTAAARLAQPRSAFGFTMAGLAGMLGWPPLVGRLFPDLPGLAPLARLVAPPLAGGATTSTLLLSMGLWTIVGLVLYVRLSRNLRGWIGAVIAALLCLGLGATTPAWAQPSAREIKAMEAASGLRVTAVPIADGLTREGRFTNIRVQVENVGPAVRGTLTFEEPTVDGQRRFSRPIEVAEGGRKLVDFPVLSGPNPLPRALWLNGGGARRTAAVVKFEPIDARTVAIGVVGLDPLGLPAAVPDAWRGAVPRRSWMPDDEDPDDRIVRTGLMQVATLPSTALGYDVLDWVVWPAADPNQLTAEQLDALLDWVADGGHLLITVTETWRSVAQSKLADALPVHLGGLEESELGPLVANLGGRATGRAPTAVGELWTGRAYGRSFDKSGRPQWAIGAYGVGSVHVLLADPNVAPLAKVNRRKLWRTLLHLPAPRSRQLDLGPLSEQWPGMRSAMHLTLDHAGHESTSSDYDGFAEPGVVAEHERWLRDRLSDIPNLAPLPVEWLLALGVFYLLWIGPFDYFILRALGRQTWTWVTFPLVIVLFGTAALVGAARLKGSQAVLLRVERIDVLPDAGRFRGDTWFGLFSTRKTAVKVQSTYADAAVLPLRERGFMNDLRFLTDGGPVALEYNAETWTLGYSRSRWMTEQAGQIDVVWNDDGTLTVSNGLDLDFKSAVLVSPDQERFPIELLDRHSSRVLNPSMNIPAPDVPDSAETMAFDLVADRGALATFDTWWFFGMADEGVEPVTIDGLWPRVEALTVVRQVIRDDRNVVGDRAMFSALFEGAADRARLVCRDQSSLAKVRGGQARIPVPSGIDPRSSPCLLEVGRSDGKWFSGVEVSIEGPNRCTVTARDVTCEAAP